MITNIDLSKDGSALIVNDREVQAICHFCGTYAPFAIKGATYKPEKWSMLYSQNRTFAKRFFICVECIHSLVHSL